MSDILKKKKHPNQLRISPTRFLVMWVGGHILGWLTLAPVLWIVQLLNWQWLNSFPDVVYGIGFGLIIGFGSTLAQMMTIRQAKGYWVKGWGIASFPAWGVGGFLFWLSAMASSFPDNMILGNMMVLGGLLLPAATVQAWLLRRYVKQSWMWLVSFVAAVAVFAMLISTFSGLFIAAIAFSGYALVTGLVMLFLFLNNSKPNPQQQTAAQVDNHTTFDSAEAQLHKFLQHNEQSEDTIDSDTWGISEQHKKLAARD